MKKISLHIEFEQYDDITELTNEDRQLFNAAKEASLAAYAPYSNFYVGSAVLLESGKIIKGSNQENAAYPSGLCAERVALFAAGAQYPGEIVKAIAIYVRNEDSGSTDPISPCGDCRQVMAEFEHRYKKPIRLIMPTSNGKMIVSNSVSALLPFMFSSDNLKDNH